MPWIKTPQARGMLYLVSPLLVMLSPEGEAESLPSLKCDLLHEAYLPCLPLLRMTIQSPCCGPLCGWHLSQSVTPQLRGPRGPANSVCSGSWCLDPSVSAAPYIDASLFWLLVKAENLTNLCAWVIWLPGGPFFFSAHHPCHKIPRESWDCILGLFQPGGPCDTTGSPHVGMGLLSTVISSQKHKQKHWAFLQVGVPKATLRRGLASRSWEEKTATFLFHPALSLHLSRHCHRNKQIRLSSYCHFYMISNSFM